MEFIIRSLKNFVRRCKKKGQVEIKDIIMKSTN